MDSIYEGGKTDFILPKGPFYVTQVVSQAVSFLEVFPTVILCFIVHYHLRTYSTGLKI